MGFGEFTKALNGKSVEGELIKTIFISLVTSAIFIAAVYFLAFNSKEFISKYGYFLLLSSMSYAVLMPALKQVRVYKEFSCMSGMMIGMTIGMLSGFLPGFFVGGTNGMFYGSVFGMAIGIFFGAANGRCCGIMGVMEGMMAGFMGGLMGAMTSIMMFNDNLKIAGVVVFLISTAIVFGLNYMIFKETREHEVSSSEGNLTTMVISFILTALTFWIMVFGPRSSLFI